MTNGLLIDHAPALNVSLSAEVMGKKAAHEIATLLRAKPIAVIGLATGETPKGMYRELVRMHKEEGLDFSHATFFNLDEYVGLPVTHPESYHQYMQEHLFAHVNAKQENIHLPDGMGAPEILERNCRDYEKRIHDAGGIDLLVLGIGENGHIGFCEPGTSADTPTHITQLTEETRRANARFFGGDISKVPTHAITMGPKTILAAKKILLLASGQKKQHAVFEALTGNVDMNLPASLLQQHTDTTFYVDRLAAKTFQEYFPLSDLLGR